MQQRLPHATEEHEWWSRYRLYPGKHSLPDVRRHEPKGLVPATAHAGAAGQVAAIGRLHVHLGQVRHRPAQQQAIRNLLDVNLGVLRDAERRREIPPVSPDARHRQRPPRPTASARSAASDCFSRATPPPPPPTMVHGGTPAPPSGGACPTATCRTSRLDGLHPLGQYVPETGEARLAALLREQP